jgi:Polyketide cyclase / dehydrase and lipid transport
MALAGNVLDGALTVRCDSTATRQQVWDIIADGWTYSQWVVGNSRMRAVDADWPAVGSRIQHSIGVWPFLINDVTEVLECRPQEELVLLANTRPFGRARISLRLSDTPDGGCRIEMAEVLVGAPLGWLPNQLISVAVTPRNRECTLRLSAIAERRTTTG